MLYGGASERNPQPAPKMTQPALGRRRREPAPDANSDPAMKLRKILLLSLVCPSNPGAHDPFSGPRFCRAAPQPQALPQPAPLAQNQLRHIQREGQRQQEWPQVQRRRNRPAAGIEDRTQRRIVDRKSTRLNSSHLVIS